MINGISKGLYIFMKGVNTKSLSIGSILRTKINIKSLIKINEELEKLKIAQKYGAFPISTHLVFAR